MKRQVWFETDLGYAATKDKLFESKIILADPEADYSGRLTFHLKNLKDFTVQITTKGKLGITYPETSNYDVVLEQLKPYLVKADNTPAKIISIIKSSELKEKPSTEKPSRFNLFSYLKWRTEYNDKKREKELKELDVEYHRLLKQMEQNEDEWKP
jgi:hypothetical protein